VVGSAEGDGLGDAEAEADADADADGDADADAEVDVLLIGMYRMRFACRIPSDRVPTTRAKSPLCRWVLVPALVDALSIIVLVSAVGDPAAGMVAVCMTIAVPPVIWTETVRSVPGTDTVMLCGSWAGASDTPWPVPPLSPSMASMIAFPSPSTEGSEAVMLGLGEALALALADADALADALALGDAEALALGSVLSDTFRNLVFLDSTHRCRLPFLDFRMRNFFDANATVPRCTSAVLPCSVLWPNVCSFTLASWERLVSRDEPHPSIAELSNSNWLIECQRELNDADCAASIELWLAVIITAAAPPPPSTMTPATNAARTFSFARRDRRERPCMMPPSGRSPPMSLPGSHRA
jgi:hypothetical protein